MKTAIEKLDDTELNGRRIRLIEDRRGGRGTLKTDHFPIHTLSLFLLLFRK